jgi:hypothetical protein
VRALRLIAGEEDGVAVGSAHLLQPALPQLLRGRGVVVRGELALVGDAGDPSVLVRHRA